MWKYGFHLTVDRNRLRRELNDLQEEAAQAVSLKLPADKYSSSSKEQYCNNASSLHTGVHYLWMCNNKVV